MKKKKKGKSIFETFSVVTLVKFFIFARFFAFVMNDFCSINPRIPEFDTEFYRIKTYTDMLYYSKISSSGKALYLSFWFATNST